MFDRKAYMREWRKKHPYVRKGRQCGANHSSKRDDVRLKLSLSKIGNEWNVGANHWNWQGGISKTTEYKAIKYHEWVIKNKQRKSFINARRRALKKNALGSHSFEEWEVLKRYYDHKCLGCKKTEPEITLTQDHIIPLIKGGSNYIDNIQPLCKSCNSIKHVKTINYRNTTNQSYERSVF